MGLWMALVEPGFSPLLGVVLRDLETALHWLLAAPGRRAGASAVLLLSTVDLPILSQQAKFSWAIKPAVAKGFWIPQLLLDPSLGR